MGETRTLCPYCGVGCGLIARTEGNRLLAVQGDPIYPVNRGRTCRKPRELPAAVHSRDRATVPMLRGSREHRFKDAGWDDAIGSLAGRLTEIRERHGPDSIAFYISGQLLTEDYYAVNKLVKGFLETNNVDSNSRLCMSSAVAGYKGAFGSDGPPAGYIDLDHADCMLLLGSNAAACHPIVWGRIADRRREGAFVICADPRTTPTAQGSDLHLPVRPGTDLALLNALLHVVIRDGHVDQTFVRTRTTGFDEASSVAAEWPPSRAAAVCGVPEADIELAARRFGGAQRAMALWSMGANQSTVGTLKNRALINLCLTTGQIGRPGTGPLSLTGQPNAMGGRETGGLSHLLPGYRTVESATDRAEMQRLWGSPALSDTPGLTAVELFDALSDGTAKAVWIVATNPLVSMPDTSRVREGLENAELVVVQDAYHPTETSALAHAVLPAAAWPEKTGTMTNSERRVGLLRAAVPPPGEALPDWRIFARLGEALGVGDAFGWEDEAAVFDEFVACTTGRVCDMSGLSHARLRREGGVQWPCPATGPEAHEGTERLYASHRFPTPDGRARFAPTPHAGPAEEPGPEYPMLLTTGRVADHWHTLTRTAKSAVLSAAAREPVLELHPDDGLDVGVGDGDRARVVSARGSVVMRVSHTDRIPRGVAFAPMHWGALHAPAGAGALNGVTHGETDPISGQPELKAAAVRVEPVGSSMLASTLAPHGSSRRRLVVVGAGMAGLEVVEELLKRRPAGSWTVTMLGEEAEPAYNRMMLSKLLARSCGAAELELRPRAWYAGRGIDLRVGLGASAIDLEHRAVLDAHGRRHCYEALVLATGSRPFVPPIPGAELPHVHAFRTLRDAGELAAAAIAGHPSVVIGGGLLGLEAAAGLMARGMRVTVVELSERVMPQQLDDCAARMLAGSLEGLGLRLELGKSVAEVGPSEVTLNDDSHILADLVVVAAGVRPEVALAVEAGIEVGRGVLVDDSMRTSAPSVWAVGECAEHRGVVQGLWAPVAEQARVAGALVAGDPAAFLGAVTATTLKVAGVDLFAGGVSTAGPGQDEIVFSDSRRGVHRKLVLDGDRLAGALLVGDTAGARQMSELLRTGASAPASLLAGPGATRLAESGAPPDGDAPVDAEESDAALVCSCNAVTRGTIAEAIRFGGLTTVAQVARATRASTGCGSCARDVEAMIGSSARNTSGTAAKPATATIAA